MVPAPPPERTLDRDSFMSAEEAVKWGLIDEILTQRPSSEVHKAHGS